MLKLTTFDPIQVGSAATATASMAASAVMGDWSVAVFGVPLSTVMAAFGGAVACNTFMPPDGLMKAVRMIFVGTMLGAYLAPLTIKLLPSSQLDGYDRPVAFLLGLGAQVGIPKFFDWIKSKGGNSNGSG